ncbi:MAG: hypothetical protein V1678_02435 [Candidatus Aenigmatarchaeota archaeon]
MKNKTFLSIVGWCVLWSLITLNYFSSIKLGFDMIKSFLFTHGFEMLIVLYGISGVMINYLIIKEEFRLRELRNKYRQR